MILRYFYSFNEIIFNLINEYIHLRFVDEIKPLNLIGFQPITFNQRTEHQFDRKYGELGMNITYRF